MHKTKTLIGIAAIALAMVTLNLPAQSTTDKIVGLFDLGNSNSLVHANEINVGPLMQWESKSRSLGGGIKLDWWLSDQQGVSLHFVEFAGGKVDGVKTDATAYTSIGYKARTVFGGRSPSESEASSARGIEVALGTGVRQRESDDFGEVQLYVRPEITWHGWKRICLTGGADFIPGQKPNAFFCVEYRAFK